VELETVVAAQETADAVVVGSEETESEVKPQEMQAQTM
jgi:hypothetical protein